MVVKVPSKSPLDELRCLDAGWPSYLGNCGGGAGDKSKTMNCQCGCTVFAALQLVLVSPMLAFNWLWGRLEQRT